MSESVTSGDTATHAVRRSVETATAPAAHDTDGRTFALRLSVFYGAMLLIYGIQVPYLPVWLDWRGLSPSEIGIAGAAPFFVRCALTPLVGVFADARGNHRQLVIISAGVGVVTTLLLAIVPGVPAIIALATLSAIAAASTGPLTETIALEGVRRAGHDYGRMRLWGSITFIVASFVGGAVIQRYGAGAGIWLLFFAMLATFLTAFLLPVPSPGEQPERSAKSAGIELADVKALLASPLFLVFLLGASAVQASHAMFYTFGVLHWQSQGLSSLLVGVLWAIGVVVEVALFSYSRAVVARFGIAEVLLAGSLGGIVRWTALAFDPSLALLLPLQTLHALSFAATHLGAMHFLAAAVPRQASGTAQSFYATVIGISQGTATIVVSSLYPTLAGKTYIAMSVLAVIGCSAALLIARRWNGGILWDVACTAAPASTIVDGAAGPPV